MCSCCSAADACSQWKQLSVAGSVNTDFCSVDGQECAAGGTPPDFAHISALADVLSSSVKRNSGSSILRAALQQVQHVQLHVLRSSLCLYLLLADSTYQHQAGLLLK